MTYYNVQKLLLQLPQPPPHSQHHAHYQFFSHAYSLLILQPRPQSYHLTATPTIFKPYSHAHCLRFLQPRLQFPTFSVTPIPLPPLRHAHTVHVFTNNAVTTPPL
ncbi:hypothetical protein E2C01_037042 [Portunus trituberculatus]|uniref:Uncharacterized protein n=1 Tax=Portunus trituberculatus TaxID=210409 RepID=A0A5B7FDK0_PORTR|nr:hypothetical protein [Portunus trituberculatus]